MKNDTFDSYFYKALSKIMIDLRKKSGKTYDEIADIVSLNPNTYYTYEIGSRKMPITIFKKLCDFYKVDMSKTLAEINDLTIKMMNNEI